MYPTRFLGLNTQNKEQLAMEERFSTNKFVTLENNKLGFEVASMGTKYTFTIE